MFFQNPFCICFSFKNLGASRGFAFVEFNTIDEAALWMDLTQVPALTTRPTTANTLLKTQLFYKTYPEKKTAYKYMIK